MIVFMLSVSKALGSSSSIKNKRTEESKTEKKKGKKGNEGGKNPKFK